MDKLKVEIHYIKRSRRATIRILPDLKVRVTVPMGVAKSEVQKFLDSKSNWIFKKYRILQEIKNEPKIEFKSGGTLPFYGNVLTLKFVDGIGTVVLKDGELIVPIPPLENELENYVKAVLIKWYRARAVEKINERVKHFSEQLGVQPKTISIKNYKARWGACSSKGDLIFNWQIITFKPELFDYVIAHEICHIKEMNHSKRFYQLLEVLGFQKREVHSQIKYLKNIF